MADSGEISLQCHRCNGEMFFKKFSKKTGKAVYVCEMGHQTTPDDARRRWHPHEDDLLTELVGTYPIAKVYREFNRAIRDKAIAEGTPIYTRTSWAIKQRMRMLCLTPESFVDDFVSRLQIYEGLSVKIDTLQLWESKGLRRDKTASFHRDIWYRKSELRRFFRLNPQVLAGRMISTTFAAILVDILANGFEDKPSSESENPDVCPRCHSHRIIKSGWISGKQRYRCKNCDKQFHLIPSVDSE